MSQLETQDLPVAVESHSHRMPLPFLQAIIREASHHLPCQGPVEVFVHHNTLHAFEHQPFSDAVLTARNQIGGEPYLDEQRFRQLLESGRIRETDVARILRDEEGQHPDLLIAGLGTRYELRLAMMRAPLITGTKPELLWMLNEEGCLTDFSPQVSEDSRKRMRQRFLRDFETQLLPAAFLRSGAPDAVFQRAKSHHSPASKDSDAELLSMLWALCYHAARCHEPACTSGCERIMDEVDPISHRTNELLVPYFSVFLDQGFAAWEFPDRSTGFFECFLQLHSFHRGPAEELTHFRKEGGRILDSGQPPSESLLDSLQILGLQGESAAEQIHYELQQLSGWAGMLCEIGKQALGTEHFDAAQALTPYLAIRFLLRRCLAENECAHGDTSVKTARSPSLQLHEQALQLAFTVFQLAQIREWHLTELLRLSRPQWNVLFREIAVFHELERRRIFQLAYEKQYRDQVLSALVQHSRQTADRTAEKSTQRPLFQLICCIDDREESLRRHVEEVAPRAQTFGMAGFFGIAMNYRGIADAGYRPLCPVSVKPQHFVQEAPRYSQVAISRWQAMARRELGRASQQAARGSRTFFGGLVTGLFGSIAAIPLVARILFPWLSSRIRQFAGSMVVPSATELRIERIADRPSDTEDGLGYSIDEMATIVHGSLKSIGITPSRGISRLVFLCGHGSGSVNNPHESAYNCGACSGGRGGPNARAFARMANDHRVRSLLEKTGLAVPQDTWFIGGYHDTCSDSLSWFDVDQIPIGLRQEFEQAQTVFDEARGRSARERCRKFDSAAADLTAREALTHVEGRAEDLSQVRPEYNHATTALCLVGSRDWSRGLFLDRRAFLTSYEPGEDTPDGQTLSNILQAVIPVCAGISLEYYFSTVDNERYGCGNKLPHNLTSLLGVMAGASSDLRPGLAKQMIEIHEPMRLLFVIETDVAHARSIIASTPRNRALLNGSWIQVAVFDPLHSRIHLWDGREFVLWKPGEAELPAAASSCEWSRGKREPLPPATICGREHC